MHILLPVAVALVKLRRKWGQTTPYRADRKHMSILLPVAVVLVKLKAISELFAIFYNCSWKALPEGLVY